MKPQNKPQTKPISEPPVNLMFVDCIKKIKEVKDSIDGFYNGLSEDNKDLYTDDYDKLDNSLCFAVSHIGTILAYDTTNRHFWHNY